MHPALLLLMQAAPISGPIAGPPAGPATPGCTPAAPGEVVVCARRLESPYRLRPLANAERFERDAAPTRAAVKLAGGELAAEADTAGGRAGISVRRAPK